MIDRVGGAVERTATGEEVGVADVRNDVAGGRVLAELYHMPSLGLRGVIRQGRRSGDVVGRSLLTVTLTQDARLHGCGGGHPRSLVLC